MITLELPYPPSVNSYKRIGKMIRTQAGKLLQTRVNSPETIAFYCDVANICRRQGTKTLGSATIELTVHLFMPDTRKRDIDNPLKVLIDSLVHARLLDDDSQITCLHVYKRNIIPGGKVIVYLAPIPGDSQDVTLTRTDAQEIHGHG